MLNYVNKVKMVIVVLVMLTFVSGCVTGGTSNKSVVDNSYKILKTTQIAYDNAMKTVAMMYKQGKITEAQKTNTIVMGKKFVTAYKVLARSLEMYADGVESPITVEQATANFIEINMSLMMFVREMVADNE